uniref:TPR_MLP1_2 domain-containing protein n=1 Tax=Panagrellus redivivus TaxID=6233 RepID=A0A7E4WCL4_PANRE
MAPVTDPERSARLLDEARQNYALLKERFVAVDSENERLKFLLEQNNLNLENERKSLQAVHSKNVENVSSIKTALLEEQRKRESDFEAFKAKTLSEIELLYKQQLEQLTGEITALETRYSGALTEVEELMNTISEERSASAVREREHRNEVLEVKYGLEQDISELSRRIRDEFNTEDELNHLQNEITAQRSIIATLNDEKAEIFSKLSSELSAKDAELRKLRDQVFDANRKRTESEMAAQKSEVELSALQKALHTAADREKQLQSRLAASEHARIKFESESRQRETDREIRGAEVQAKHEMQIHSLGKKLAEAVAEIKAKDTNTRQLHRQFHEVSHQRDALQSEIQSLRQTVANLEAKIECDRRTFDAKLDELAFDRDCARKKAADVMSKSKADQYLNQIDQLKEELLLKDEEIVQLKAHYRGLLSKMKRAVEKAQLKTPNTR